MSKIGSTLTTKTIEQAGFFIYLSGGGRMIGMINTKYNKVTRDFRCYSDARLVKGTSDLLF